MGCPGWVPGEATTQCPLYPEHDTDKACSEQSAWLWVQQAREAEQGPESEDESKAPLTPWRVSGMKESRSNNKKFLLSRPFVFVLCKQIHT